MIGPFNSTELKNTIESRATSFMGVALMLSRFFGNIGIKTEETDRTEVPG